MADNTVKYDGDTATIAHNAALSGAVDMRGHTLLLVLMPAAWTAANIGFKVSVDGENYYPAYDADGSLLEIASPAASRACAAPTEVCVFPWVKLWSQSSGSDVNQTPGAGQVRTLALVKKTG